MDDTKHPLKSLGIMGPSLALIVFAANTIHPGLGLTTDQVAPVIDDVDALIGFGTAIVGRWRATKQIALNLLPLFVIAGGLTLSACTLTGNPAADLAAFQVGAQASVKDFNTKLASLNAGVVAQAIPVGQAACGVANQLNAVFVGPLGQIGVQLGAAAAGAPAVVPAVDASEALVWTDVQKGCAVIDAANPATPTADELAAVQALIADVPQIEAAIAKVSPTAAQLLAPQS